MNVPQQPRDFEALSADALEQLLAAVTAGDQPEPELASLYAVLSAASSPAEPGAQPGESAALAAFTEAAPVRRMRRTPVQWLAESKTRLAVATGAGVLVLSGGVAAAATGSLPGPAQGAAHAVLGAIGVHVPTSSDDNGSGDSNGNGTSDTAPGQTGAHPSPRPSGETGKPEHPIHPAHPAHPTTPSHPTPSHPAPHATLTPTHPVTPEPSRRPTAPPTPH